MGASKTKGFNKSDIEMADLARAMGHPARVVILKRLIASRSCICRDIVDELPLSQSTVSQHLKELKTAGIIKGTISGTSICYCIDERVWSNLKKLLGEFLESFAGQTSC
jgi:DNA-binding transcriptional ArsR family regulator